VKALPTLSTDEPKYSAWRKKFNPLEDGFAAKRVVDAVWGSK
jgi:CDP-glycerol glycerophosphotransferase (TagB/SpsB family)